MYHVEDEPIETIHLYVVREGNAHPSLIPVLLSLLALCLLIAIGILTPYKQPNERATLRVPAILLPLRTFTTTVSVIPTGIRQYPATTAHGTLTITNGSILSQELPKGMILTGTDGVEVTTDAAAFVPAGSAEGFGIAHVSAYAAISGKRGNIPARTIDSVEGTSLYIRNLQRFTGGEDALTVRFTTALDRLQALSQARYTLRQQTNFDLLQSPCQETDTGSQVLRLSWTCQFVTYRVPSYMRVTKVNVQGRYLLIDVVFGARPRHIATK